MKVSVIIPFYSNLIWLEEAVESVFDQTFKDYEIIVVNDGSPEDDKIFLKKYKNKIVYFKTVNKGPAHARNYGINIAKGKYLAFLDSDDLWQKTKLEKQVRLMDENDAIWSHTNWAQFSDNIPSNISKTYNEGNQGYIYPSSLLSVNIATPSVMVKADYLKKNPDLRFQEKMRFGQDYYLWLLLSIEAPIFLVPEVLCFARLRHGENAVTRARVHIQLRAQIWYLVNNYNPEIFLKIKKSRLVRITYLICVFQYKFINWLEKNLKIGYKSSEIFSKILYVFPYLSFRFLKKLLF